MGLTWKAHGRLDQLRPELDGLTGGLPSSPGWLQYAESVAARRGIEVGYLTASFRGSVIAAMAHYRVDRAEDVSLSYRWSPRRSERSSHDHPLLFLGAMNGHLCEPAAALSFADQRLELLGSAAAHLASVYPDVSLAALYVPLPAREKISSDVTTLRHDAVLDVSRFTSLADYLGGLQTKRRQNARREIRAAAAVGGWSGLLVAPQPKVWAALVAQHAEKFGRRLLPEVVEDEIESLRLCFGTGLVAFGYRHAGRLRAVSIGIVWSDTLYMKSIGIERAYERRGLYSCVGYFEPIEWATRRGLRAICFGVNAARAKCLRGCGHRRLVGCAFDHFGRPRGLRSPAPPIEEAQHVEECPRQV